jgi:CPA1 family monovalent cation:H+ antiporter
VILVAAYAVVLFTIVVQGLSLDRVVRRTALPDDATAPGPDQPSSAPSTPGNA